MDIFGQIGSLYFNAGDLDFFWPEQIRAFSWLPRIFWSDTGLGVSGLQSLWLTYPFTLITKLLFTMGIPWWLTEKLLWGLGYAMGIYAVISLGAYLGFRRRFRFLSAFIYLTNTYALLLFGGGQLGVFWAYASVPLVLRIFVELIDRIVQPGLSDRLDLCLVLRGGLAFAVLVALDIRLAYLSLFPIILYGFFRILPDIMGKRTSSSGGSIRRLGRVALGISVVTGLLHAYWLFPVLGTFGKGVATGTEYTGEGMLRFLSFADFPHALSLLHPNWPSNLFGKVSFLQPVFLMLPVIAFSGLLAIGKTHVSKSKTQLPGRFIVFFALLGLTGAFLSKGVNPPFGEGYAWLFLHFPGFVMFRDPTKFYLFTALAYAILIPFSLQSMSGLHFGKNRTRTLIQAGVPVVFVVVWFFMIRELPLGQLRGNFTPIRLTTEYTRLKDLLEQDPVASRTLWLPSNDDFAYRSETHPLLTGASLFAHASVSGLIRGMGTPAYAEAIGRAGVGYVVVPRDAERSLFLTDYRFDSGMRQDLIRSIEESGLEKVDGFDELAVFRNASFDFQSEKPAVIGIQEQLARWGTLVSALTLLVALALLWTGKRRNR